MCTAITFATKDHYFGRNLDLDVSYGEAVTITPRNFTFSFRRVAAMPMHQALIGMAVVAENQPLYYDATNESGLSMAGLNFPGNAVYFPEKEGCDNVAPFELIPWILGQCSTLNEARTLLQRLNVLDLAFSKSMPLAPLHWIIADRTGALVLESTVQGLQIYDNPTGVLANNPPFSYHLANLNQYLHLTAGQPENRFAPQLTLTPDSLGLGALGLPGDLSSPSRFVRAAFARANAVCGQSEDESVSQFFHILGTVAQARGCNAIGGGRYETTLYSSCCNTDQGIYYYTTYDNSQITSVALHRENLDSDQLAVYPLIRQQQIYRQN